MIKLIFLIFVFVNSAFIPVVKAEQCDILGVWNHATKPAELYIDISKGEILVHSHKTNPESVGLVVIKSLKLSTIANTWNAQMYNAVEDSFVDVQLSSDRCKELNVRYHGESVLGLFR